MIALLVMHDGRDTIDQTIPSAEANLRGPITERYIHVDGPEVDVDRLVRLFPLYTIILPDAERQGFDGAIRRAWGILRSRTPARFVFHLEDDFTFRRPVDLVDLMTILDTHPHLVNLALRRQPWNPHEINAGGIVEQHPDAYTERGDDRANSRWLEHRLFFTTNPGLYRRRLLDRQWPTGAHSEGRFSHEILGEDPDARFGYYGARDSGEWVHHIGTDRNGIGY